MAAEPKETPKETAKEPKRCLILTVKPGYNITVESRRSENKEVVEHGGQRKFKEIISGQMRTVSAVNHVLWMDDADSPEMDRIRGAAGYGIKFFEAMPHPRIPKKSLWEMKKDPKRAGEYRGRLQEMEKIGHKRVTEYDLNEMIVALAAKEGLR